MVIYFYKAMNSFLIKPETRKKKRKREKRKKGRKERRKYDYQECGD